MTQIIIGREKKAIERMRGCVHVANGLTYSEGHANELPSFYPE